MADGFFSFQNAGTGGSNFNSLAFMMQQHTRRMNSSTVVKVIAVTNDGDTSPVGFVDIQPMVDLVDGDNNRIAHGVIYHCPYFRLQGGSNAIILDPQVGDMGIALFADRDISSVCANKGQAAPGSARRFSFADGMYVGGLLNGVPTQYMQFSADGITIKSPTKVQIEAPDVKIIAPTVEINASTSVTMTTPTFMLNGSMVVTETVQAAEVDAPIVTVATTLTVAGKDIGPLHVHDHGTMTSTGHTGIVI